MRQSPSQPCLQQSLLSCPSQHLCPRLLKEMQKESTNGAWYITTQSPCWSLGTALLLQWIQYGPEPAWNLGSHRSHKARYASPRLCLHVALSYACIIHFLRTRLSRRSWNIKKYIPTEQSMCLNPSSQGRSLPGWLPQSGSPETCCCRWPHQSLPVVEFIPI